MSNMAQIYQTGKLSRPRSKTLMRLNIKMAAALFNNGRQ